MDIITGFITQFIYQNEENGFAIAKLKTQDHKSVIITGNIAVLEVGNFIEATYNRLFVFLSNTGNRSRLC